MALNAHAVNMHRTAEHEADNFGAALARPMAQQNLYIAACFD